MSELKAFNCVESDLQEFCEPRLVYLKSEADKVIAGKDKEISELKEERRWRKFSEEKPKDKQLVLVHGDNWFEIAIYHDNGLIDFGDDIHFSNITETPYWMPPPLSPKEKA